MNNEELEKKIMKIIDESVDAWAIRDKRGRIHVHIDKIAYALIAGGMGDVKEAEHRAEVAEKAGRIIQRDMARVFDISNPRVCELIANIWDLAKKQAEKELAEEGKDD